MIERKTILSPDRAYRYTLWREWDFPAVNKADLALGFDGFKKLRDSKDFVQFICLNPSTADETKDDPTIRKCIGFAKRWGFGALCMTNLFSFRATLPKDMRRQENPVGEDNPHHLLQVASESALVVAAWGVNGSFRNQDLNVKELLGRIGIQLKCLRKTKAGQPEHPLYVPYETQLVPL